VVGLHFLGYNCANGAFAGEPTTRSTRRRALSLILTTTTSTTARATDILNTTTTISQAPTSLRAAQRAKSAPTTQLLYRTPELPATPDTIRILTSILRRTNTPVKNDLFARQDIVVHQPSTIPTPSRADTPYTPNTLRLRAIPRSFRPVWHLTTTARATRPVPVTMEDNTTFHTLSITTLHSLSITQHLLQCRRAPPQTRTTRILRHSLLMNTILATRNPTPKLVLETRSCLHLFLTLHPLKQATSMIRTAKHTNHRGRTC
jgi:hypothetical protein